MLAAGCPVHGHLSERMRALYGLALVGLLVLPLYAAKARAAGPGLGTVTT